MRTILQVILGVAVIAAAYFFGGLSTGMWIASRSKGMDIRKYGSGSSGATNVLRVLGRGPGVATFAGDLLKGIIAGLFGLLIGPYIGISNMAGAALCGFCAVVGHIWPAASGFRGGKGVATAAGVFLIVASWQGVVSIAAALVCIFLTRIVSIGSLLGAVLFFLLTGPWGWMNNRPWMFFFSLGVAGVVFFAHRSNIKRLLSGTENTLDFSKLFEKSR
ncbi:MAG: glycerol-3-phosphate acyltransferase [Oscillospiraceae bacterium]|jgi:glycerol-3-phosphate acyltransferase PlsY|nr:glycerol-3-phosphate acyltransferase [Oscillospiraceae bacterium]